MNGREETEESLTRDAGPDQIQCDSVSHLKTNKKESHSRPTREAADGQYKSRRQRRLRSRDHRQSSLWSCSRPQRWSRSILSARRGCAVEAAPRSLSLLDTPSLEHTLLTLVAVHTLCFSADPCRWHFTHLGCRLFPRSPLFCFFCLLWAWCRIQSCRRIQSCLCFRIAIFNLYFYT